MVVYAFRCVVCGTQLDEVRAVGQTAPPLHCGQPTRREYRVTRPINRPQGYSLHPGDKGYWDYGVTNAPGYRPPERLEPFQRYFEAERDIERATHQGVEPV